MAYPAQFEASIRRVAESREARLKEKFAPLTAAGKQDLLEAFHPDYIEASMREVRVGPNKGDRTPKELADLLEVAPTLKMEEVDLSRTDRDVDVLVLGGGGAGCSAALTALDAGADVLLATKLRLGDANTMMAQGG
ncbi:MAG: FAD-binding protein, partial [Planctomycetota bacterium]